MIVPSKTTPVIDSLICISAVILDILKLQNLQIDDLHEKLNIRYKKKVTIEKLILCLDFLYLIDKIEENNGIIRANFKQS